MADIQTFDIRTYNDMVGAETLHPLVGVVDFSKLPPILFDSPKRMFGYYAVYLKGKKYTELHYGDSIYDYSEGALVFFAPGQVAGSETDGERHQVQGHVLMFHPDLLAGTSLQALMKTYTYFSYNTNEALFPTEREKSLIVDIFGKIDEELHADVPDKVIIVDYIKLVLDYCQRAFERQFKEKPVVLTDILSRFERLCDEYYKGRLPQTEGLLTVQYCSDKLCLSVNYFSDVVRKMTGLSPQKHIQQKMMEKAKTLILSTSKRVNQIADELGFQQSQNFSSWFKRIEGCTPKQYREKVG